MYNAAKAVFQPTVSGVPTRFSPEQISAMVLDQLKAAAEAHIGTPITDAGKSSVNLS